MTLAYSLQTPDDDFCTYLYLPPPFPRDLVLHALGGNLMVVIRGGSTFFESVSVRFRDFT